MAKGKWSEDKKKAWSLKCKATGINNRTKSIDTMKEWGKILSAKNREIPWTAERRKRQSEAMLLAVSKNPDSYTKSNVSGRAKLYECVNSFGELTKVKGRWELKVSEYLNSKNIKWTNDIPPYSYYWNNGWHLYYPDFYLTEYNILIEVKGYKTDRDDCKWAAVKDKVLKVFMKKEIEDIANSIDSIIS